MVPVVPAAMLFDGIVSCLRMYTPDEMKAMAVEVGGESFKWEAGIEYPPGSAIPIPYLMGTPLRTADETARCEIMALEGEGA